MRKSYSQPFQGERLYYEINDAFTQFWDFGDGAKRPLEAIA